MSKDYISEEVFSEKGFYVGDICYVLSHDIYHKIWGDKWKFQIGKIEVPEKNSAFAVSHTAWGDGCYYDDEGREYLVDAANIGIVPAELIDDSCEGGHFFEGAGKAYLTEENGIFDIELPNQRCLSIDTDTDDFY